MKSNIVLMLCQYSVVVKGIEKLLMDKGFHVEVLSENFQVMIKHYASNTGLFVLYLPGDISDSMRNEDTLIQICRMINIVGGNMLVVGEKKYETELVKNMPVLGEYPWYYRPIDMETFEPAILKAIVKGAKTGVKHRILVVDDDPSYARMIKEWLKDDYKVDLVTAGMQAITFLLKATEPVDLILLDYEMPVADGPQVLQMLRQDPKTENIPVVFLTGLGTKEAVQRVMSLKPEGYILKSTTRIELLEFLSNRFKS